MLDKTISALDILLNPRSPAQWVWKLAVLCFLASSAGVLVREVFGHGVNGPLINYYLMTSVTSFPFWALGIGLYKRMDGLQRELARIASTDILTGLANRRAFFERMQQIEDGQLLLLDVDHFKSVNDQHGHALGDRVLVEVARHLLDSVRSEDIVARIGGEEFAVYLPKATEDEARKVAERMTRGLTVTDKEVELSITLSAGLAATGTRTTVSELIGRADSALYRAKAAGRARMEKWGEAARVITRPT